jgi:hypothetical protein
MDVLDDAEQWSKPTKNRHLDRREMVRGGRNGSVTFCSSLACPAKRLPLILEKTAELNPKGFREVPKRHNRWVSLASSNPLTYARSTPMRSARAA